jgi:hypothetical protein
MADRSVHGLAGFLVVERIAIVALLGDDWLVTVLLERLTRLGSYPQ